ncbi:MAG: serpin family protein, partial [Gemmatimonadota bacterium]|nr:serpin family protein [Gemmatimonadota bacterium]
MLRVRLPNEAPTLTEVTTVPAATITSATLASALCSYAERFHGSSGATHHIASPLGAWMLLALCARGTDGRLRDELTAILGVDVDAAASFTAALLAEPHPAVASAAAVWTRPGLPAESLAGWLAGLPFVVERGDIPSQVALDAWAREHTLGLIERFPITLHPRALFLLATALATKVSWVEPFETVPARELARPTSDNWPDRLKRPLGADAEQSADWSTRLHKVLKAPMWEESHSQFIATTDRAGDVAVHTGTALRGLSVTSVIAERGVSPSDVLGAAYELATRIAQGRDVAQRSLFELPVGHAPLWSIEEEQTRVVSQDGREERHTAVLPAWSAVTVHDLDRPELGFPAAVPALGRLAGEPQFDYVATQSALARYTRTGFEAAALSTVMGLAGSAMPHLRPGVVRTATLRFGHPFAVVAVATETPDFIRATGTRE